MNLLKRIIVKYHGQPWLPLGMGMLVYGVAESFGPVVAILQIIPSNLAFLGYSLPFIAGGIGAFMPVYWLIIQEEEHLS